VKFERGNGKSRPLDNSRWTRRKTDFAVNGVINQMFRTTNTKARNWRQTWATLTTPHLSPSDHLPEDSLRAFWVCTISALYYPRVQISSASCISLSANLVINHEFLVA